MPELRECIDDLGRSPFGRWFDRLAAPAAAKIRVALGRLAAGGAADVASVGGGVAELRIHWGPGYRVYIGRDGETLILLLAGGTKARQDREIAHAKERWSDYRRRKRAGEA